MTKKFSSLLLLLCLSLQALHAQKLLPQDEKALRRSQDTLQKVADQMLHGLNDNIKQNALEAFIPKLVRALKTNNSFYFPFDSLQTISIKYPKDSTFRIFTWLQETDNGFFQHHGAIQLNTPDGSLKLFALIDSSDAIVNRDTITSNKAWYGCLYYNIVQTHFFNQEYYTLLGWDGNNPRSQKKLLEMLTFKNGQPVFGGPYFSFEEDTVKRPTQNRFFLEYKKEAAVMLNFSADMDEIVFDHLISEINEPSKKFTYVPDMDYEAFKWKGGKWVHIDKIFHDALPNGKPPIPVPLDMKSKDNTHIQSEEEVQAQKAAEAAAQQPATKKKPGKKQ
ncbi:hypothetical protein GA0116948_104130 [Chitinophaga costaii]|uniref:Uncharacterized protein n=1 Tax=Chitinophaga costaii TaxID=1335309 RepID=A0A1C4CHU5_9BACT|nr:hypothetical protein [Chitinophaga costaii]PUZ27086.1 hypothetical protein DCM91_07630 [Chitinophaga costaii]SCC18616.1 hypothetical protein GA0116948_104130 [Chitinophaga costaii]